jgi:hypothetical protein
VAAPRRHPLEHETARQLRIAGFYAEQGRHYTDPLDPTTNRETDVVAMAALTSDVARIILVVECKVSDDRPWVVLTSPTRPERWSPITRGTVDDFLATRAGLIPSLLPQDKPYGFSVVETMRDTKGKDRAHDAMDQVVSATLGIMKIEHRQATGSCAAALCH